MFGKTLPHTHTHKKKFSHELKKTFLTPQILHILDENEVNKEGPTGRQGDTFCRHPKNGGRHYIVSGYYYYYYYYYYLPIISAVLNSARNQIHSLFFVCRQAGGEGGGGGPIYSRKVAWPRPCLAWAHT
jgi:hypothetical protein